MPSCIARLPLPLACLLVGAGVGALVWFGAPAAAGPGQVSTTPTPAPRSELVLGPGSATLQPGDTVSFVFPHAPNFLRSPLQVTSTAAQPAALSEDGDTLTIAVPAGLIVIANLVCAPMQGQFNSVSCYHGHSFPPAPDSISFTTAPLSSAAPLPQSATIAAGDTVRFVNQDGSAAIAIQAAAISSTSGESVQATWDGSALTLTPAAGASIVAAAPTQAPHLPGNVTPVVVKGLICTPADGAPGLSCPLDGRPPQLVSVILQPNPIGFLPPPHHQPALFLDPHFTTRPAAGPSGLPVGQPVTFTIAAQARAGDAFKTVIWDFGDGTGASGLSVTHTYDTPGEYAVQFYAADTLGIGYAQTAPQPVWVAAIRGQATYPAGWNLVAGPDGTVLSAAAGPIYALSSCPAEDTASVPAGCTAGYQPLPASAPLRAGTGYWAYFPAPAMVVLAPPQSSQATVTMPPSGVTLIGNPANDVALLIGADTLLVYDPAQGQYRQAVTLQPGQAGWVYAAPGSQVMVYAPFATGATAPAPQIPVTATQPPL